MRAPPLSCAYGPLSLRELHPNSNGALTIVAPAQAAQLPHNTPTRRHVDLKNEFYDKVREGGQIPDSEIRLRQQIVKL